MTAIQEMGKKLWGILWNPGNPGSGRITRLIGVGLFTCVFVFMGLVIYRDRERILSFDWHLQPGYLLLTAIFYSATLALLFVVWRSILRTMNGRVKLASDFRIYYLSLLARRLPSALWYIASRLVMYRQQGVPEATVLSSTTLESLSLALGGVLAFLTLLPFYDFQGLADRTLPIAVGGLALALVLSQPQLVLAGISRLLVLVKREPVHVTVRRKAIATWLIVHLISWLVGGAGLFLTVKSVYVVSWTALPGVIGIATVSTLMSLLMSFIPGGSSLKELALSALLSHYVPLSAGIMIALTYRIWLTLLDVGWALLATRFGGTGEGAGALPAHNSGPNRHV